MTNSHADLLVRALWAAFPVMSRLVRSGWETGGAKGLSAYHAATLSLLLDQARVSMSEICGRLGVARSNFSPIVETLVRKGLVRRETDRDDRRVIRISLTVKGKKVMRKVKEHGRKSVKKALGGLGERRLRALIESLQAVKTLKVE